MTAAPAPTSLDAETSIRRFLAEGDVMGVMRICHGKRLDREGTPMVLGLVDERRPIPVAPTTAQQVEGERLVRVFDEAATALVPWAHDADEDAVILTMQIVAATHFAPGALPASEVAADLTREETRA